MRNRMHEMPEGPESHAFRACPAEMMEESARGMVAGAQARALRGRGARSAHAGRHERFARVAADDGWGALAALAEERRQTEVIVERASSIITRNNSPDVGFEYSVNPYRGCEHGCIYCYARPGHANLGLSPGLDFESRIVVKENAPQLFEKAITRPGWKGVPVAIGTYTDCYQPLEKQYRITRRLLEIAERHDQPVMLVTKSRLVLRDLDILRRLASKRLVRVAVAITTLDAALARLMEPRAATPARRLETLGRLADAGVPTSLMLAPVIPAINDHEIERILVRARHAGTEGAAMVMLRLPLEIAELFREWLEEHFPERASRVLSLIRQMHGGRIYDSRFGRRMTGAGPHAWMIWRRFENTCRRLGLNARITPLNTELFARRRRRAEQRQPLLPGLL